MQESNGGSYCKEAEKKTVTQRGRRDKKYTRKMDLAVHITSYLVPITYNPMNDKFCGRRKARRGLPTCHASIGNRTQAIALKGESTQRCVNPAFH